MRIIFILSLLLVFAGCATDEPANANPRRGETAAPGTGVSSDGPVPSSGSEEKPAASANGSDFDGGKAAEISVATLGDNEFLNLAAKIYEERKGTKVNIIYYNNEADDVARFSQIMYTALMGGGGDDIIDMSLLTWNKAGERGMLKDLNEYLIFPPDEYYINILDAFLLNNKRYVVPLTFSFGAYQFGDAYSEDEPPRDITPEDLFALAEKYPDAKLFDLGSGLFRPAALMYRMFEVYSVEFIDTENNKPDIDNEKFISLLKKIEALDNQLQPSPNGQDSILRSLSPYNAVLGSWGIVDYDRVFLMTDKKEEGRYAFSSGDFMPAINANSSRAETAADFIQFLLSAEMQSSLELGGAIPVNINAANEIAALKWEQLKNQGSEIEPPDNFDLQEQVEKFNKLVSRLNYTQTGDVMSNGFISDEIIKYFDGGYTAEDTAKSLQAKLMIYLQE